MKELTTVLRRIEQHVQNVMQLGGIGGLAYALTDRERLLAVGTAGYADIAARRLVTPETRFEICSITKSFTALAVMQLYEQGIIDIHAPLTAYLPWCETRRRGDQADDAVSSAEPFRSAYNRSRVDPGISVCRLVFARNRSAR